MNSGTPRTNVVNVIIVGAGLMGHWHAHYARKSGARIAAIVDRDAKAGRELAGKFRASVFQDAGECFQSASFDVVHICTPTESHFSLSKTALQKGMHVLVEKPAAMSILQTQELLDLASTRGVKMNPIHQFPFQSGFLELLKRQNELGDPVRVSLEICTAGGTNRSKQARRAILIEMIPHAVSMFLRLLGPGAVEALRLVQTADEDDLEMAGRTGYATAHAFFSHRGRPTRNVLVYTATSGTAHVDLFHGFCFIERHSTTRASKAIRPLKNGLDLVSAASLNLAFRALRAEWAYPGLGELIARFYRSVLEQSAPPIGAAEIIAAARLAEFAEGRG